MSRVVDSELLTVHEIAQALRVDDTTCRRWIKSGALEAISLPHNGKRQAYRIRRATLDALLTSTVALPAHNSHNHHSHTGRLEAVTV